MKVCLAIPMSEKKGKSGRPSIQSSQSIQKELREYFLQGYSSEFTSEQTGHNIKTVYKYFHEFAEQITQSETDDFLERQQLERTRIIISLDRQIFSAKKYAQEIQNDIKKFRDEKNIPPSYLMSSHMEVMKYITSLIETKGSFSMKPTMTHALQEKLREMRDGQD